MKTKDTDLRELVREMVHAAIEGSDCELIDLVAILAHCVGVPYKAVDCATCGGLADAATARDHDLIDGPLCGSCKLA